MSDIVAILNSLLTSMNLEPYIRYIRFPHFKNLESNLKIDFDFPLTALVGQNGTNKSSVLRAVYGCPEDQNVGNFWFSTDVDPITETDGRPRFIYSYFQPEANQQVEVIKTRIKRKYPSKKKGARTRINPDYWEPSRPLVNDGMEKMPTPSNGKGRTATRWKLIEKDVIFIDFRSEISAFDKYFYHGDLNQTLLRNSKQDFIRSKSIHIKNAADRNLQSKKMYKGKKEQIFSNEVLSDEAVTVVSEILGKKYTKLRVLQHRFFDSVGVSVILSSSNLVYSEAFAGSGEFAVITLVDKILRAKPKSLILLDEPEVSLHPGAQRRLVSFLLSQIKKQKHQIVIGTHSPFIIEDLPKNAIKTLYIDPATDKIKATNETVKEEAFFHLGIQSESKKTIFVEDRLASAIVKRALKILGQAFHQMCDVKVLPGGTTTLLQNYLPSLAMTDRVDSLFLVDGDQKVFDSLKSKEDITNENPKQVSSYIIKLKF